MAQLREKIGYALGDAAAGGITWKVMSIAFPLFFTNVFGLTVADTATLMLIARMFDVVTDPLMGTLADRTQSRWGTYRPWIIFGSIPFGLIFALLLYTPEFGPVGKRIWAYTLYLLMMVVYTAVNVPYGSLLGVMTNDDNEKNQFSSYRMVGAYAMGFITLLSFPYLQKLVGGTDQHQYAVLGAFFGVLAAAGTLACGLLTKERLKPVRAEKFSLKPFGDLFRNRPWIILTLIGICMNFFNGFRYAVAGYMFEYCMHGDVTVSGLIINYTVFMTFGELTCMVFGGVSPIFTKWVGSKRKAFLWAAAICVATSVLFFFVPMDAAYIWLMVAIVIVTSIERHLVNRSHLLIRHDGSEVWYRYQWFTGGPPVGHRRLYLWHRCRWSDHHHHHRCRQREQDDLGTVLHLPCYYCRHHDRTALYLPNKEINPKHQS